MFEFEKYFVTDHILKIDEKPRIFLPIGFFLQCAVLSHVINLSVSFSTEEIKC